MNVKTKIPFGINSVSIGNYVITTIKLIVGNDFILDKLPMEVKVLATRKGYMLTYESIANDNSINVCQELGKCLKEHSKMKLERKYSWVQIQ